MFITAELISQTKKKKKRKKTLTRKTDKNDVPRVRFLCSYLNTLFLYRHKNRSITYNFIVIFKNTNNTIFVKTQTSTCTYTMREIPNKIQKLTTVKSE